ncbi:MAG: hypothetical protein EBU46_15885, partial [Nitrosomonadaceae bacterium]|nr:hypothetical protein [Nitrosomonadaceae bacterium]
AAVDAKDSLAEQHTNVLMHLNRAMQAGDPQAVTNTTAYLQQPHVKDFLQNHSQMVKYPHTAQLAETMAQRAKAW